MVTRVWVAGFEVQSFGFLRFTLRSLAFGITDLEAHGWRVVGLGCT